MTRRTSSAEPTSTKRDSEADHAPPAPSADTMADTQELGRLRLDDDPTVAVSADARFRASWRGYDRDQVDKYRARVEADLGDTRVGYQRALRAQAQLREQLQVMDADLARLRGQLANRPSALSERLREILHLAEQDAEETRAAAQAEARQTRADAQADADQVRADAETVLRQAEEAAAALLSRVHAEQQKGRAELEQEQARVRQELSYAIAEAEQARQRADAAAAARRDQADQQARERREHANAAAEARLRETSAQVAELTRQRDEVIASLSGLHDALVNIVAPPTDPAAASQ